MTISVTEMGRVTDNKRYQSPLHLCHPSTSMNNMYSYACTQGYRYLYTARKKWDQYSMCIITTAPYLCEHYSYVVIAMQLLLDYFVLIKFTYKSLHWS